MGSNADVIRRLTDEPFIAGNFETWDEIVAGDLVDNDPMPGLPPDGEGLKTLAEMVVGTFDDRKIDAEYLETPDGPRRRELGVHRQAHGRGDGHPAQRRGDHDPGHRDLARRGREDHRTVGRDRRQRRDAEGGPAALVAVRRVAVESSSSV